MPANSLRLIHSDTWTSSPPIPEPKKEILEEGKQSAKVEMDIESLYPAQDALSTHLRVALDALKEVTQLTSSAIECLIDGDLIGTDDNIQRVYARMHDLFCQRALGEGFGAVISACMCAFENLKGSPLTQIQVQAIDQVLRKTREKPLMKYESALDLVQVLEDAGLEVEPRGFDALADFLSG